MDADVPFLASLCSAFLSRDDLGTSTLQSTVLINLDRVENNT
jgi:hypothetical protein